MNRYRLLLVATPLAALSIGAPIGLWALRQRSLREKSADLPLAQAKAVSARQNRGGEDESTLDKILTKEDKLSYEGYLIEKSQVKGEESWTATLKKGNHVVAKFENGWNKEWTNFGLFSFTGAEPKQLVVEQYSGGAHCCYSYWIYELSPSLRLLFGSERYGTGNQLFSEDIDGDGVSELRQSVMAFDYFHMSHASSVFPQAVFAYDRTAGEYRPANRRFSSYLLRGIEDDIKEVEKIKAEKKSGDGEDIYSERHFSAVLQVTLRYIYAGQRDKGWAFFDREYRKHENIGLEKMRAEINDTLSDEPVYKYIYSNTSE